LPGQAIVDLKVMFQSTPFARRETTVEGEVNRVIDVSIHSLRKKGDSETG